jgi:hypothetical protein
MLALATPATSDPTPDEEVSKPKETEVKETRQMRRARERAEAKLQKRQHIRRHPNRRE